MIAPICLRGKIAAAGRMTPRDRGKPDNKGVDGSRTPRVQVDGDGASAWPDAQSRARAPMRVTYAGVISKRTRDIRNIKIIGGLNDRYVAA